MKAATLTEIKKELQSREKDDIIQMCLRLGRFKKDSKELLTYLLFDAQDESAYIQNIKYDIDDLMDELNTTHVYYAKKGLQKMLRNLNKYIRYSGQKQTEVEVLIYFCESIRDSGIDIGQSSVLNNMYDRQLAKINKALSTLHEDIHADYQKAIDAL